MAIMLDITATEDGIWPKQKSHEEWLDRYGLFFASWVHMRYTDITDSKSNYYKIIEHIVLWNISNLHIFDPDE